ncbi:hypothetical protein LC593_09170 [Nostoc sp. CHAB 5844]|nr:hypothetical protein [Nostoc sp. CHAB 5844]
MLITSASAVAHGGNRQDRAASPLRLTLRDGSHYNGGNLPSGSQLPAEGNPPAALIHRNALPPLCVKKTLVLYLI